MEKIVGVAQLYFMPHPLLEIVQRLMAHPVYFANMGQKDGVNSQILTHAKCAAKRCQL